MGDLSLEELVGLEGLVAHLSLEELEGLEGLVDYWGQD